MISRLLSIVLSFLDGGEEADGLVAILKSVAKLWVPIDEIGTSGRYRSENTTDATRLAVNFNCANTIAFSRNLEFTQPCIIII